MLGQGVRMWQIYALSWIRMQVWARQLGEGLEDMVGWGNSGMRGGRLKWRNNRSWIFGGYAKGLY